MAIADSAARGTVADVYKVAHSEHSQLSKPTIQKQMGPDASWIDTMYGYMDGCSGMT